MRIGKKLKIGGFDDQFEIILTEDGWWRARFTRQYGFGLIHLHCGNTWTKAAGGFFAHHSTAEVREDEFGDKYNVTMPAEGYCDCDPPDAVMRMFNVIKLQRM
jgi:hypothetical protein